MPSRRPPPPEPTSNDGPPPPPLPNRPRGAPNGTHKPKAKPRAEADDYLNADEWKTYDDGAPALPPRNFSPSPEEGELYEEPDTNTPPLPPPPSRNNQPNKPASEADFGGEVYDELEGIAEDNIPKQQTRQLPPPPQPGGEIYDQCDVMEQTAETGGEIYEDPEVNPSDEPEVGEIYEEPDQTSVPQSNSTRRDAPLPPPPPSPKAPPQPPPTNSLPAALPSRTSGPSQQAKLQAIKKISGDGPAQLGISQDMIGQKRAALRKVSSEKEIPDLPSTALSDETADDTSSVQDMISKFKAVESGPRPSLTVKPSVHTVTLSSRNLPPPPPPPIYSAGFQTHSVGFQTHSSGFPPPPLPPINPTLIQKLQPDTRSKSPTPQVPSVKPVPKSAPEPAPYEEEIYDDALNVLPPKDPLEGEVWYHGERERNSCESDLSKNGQDGSYLVRKSIKGGDTQPYTLVVLYKNHVYNLRIRRRPDDKIALGNEKEAEQELAFDSVPELIAHHTSNEVILINKNENKQYRAVLKNPLRSS